eukprot:CAMPEP_0172715200 /NCGR_PEP_ID=MMETSP1074-20121228/67408_1 /TAXON_ID=2916 /ORGANISM="Ceratium fusus, Strain PA161109" /LENGTH=69 /DNA_ID=CAMNT_0013539755 /DNA_START=1013 /DNA_END=1218 /DNA_ORIENTATION=-
MDVPTYAPPRSRRRRPLQSGFQPGGPAPPSSRVTAGRPSLSATCGISDEPSVPPMLQSTAPSRARAKMA